MTTPEDINRQKASMLIFALEKSLGDYVKAHHDCVPQLETTGAMQKIEGRIEDAGAQPRKSRIQRTVAASYFEEIVNLAVECGTPTSDGDVLKDLQRLVDQFDLLAVRNAVSHPNKPFADCYWYRAAAVASDPSIDKLGFTSVRLALQAAEEERITLPPDEWFQNQSFSVRNNLPRQFEHEATGLIGRQKERKDLFNSLSAGKYALIAVVAPGGLGKTSLALDVLRECTLDPKTQDWCDGIVFVSLKQEKLTADGLIQLSAAQTIEELADEIHDELSTLYPDIESASHQERLTALSDQRIVLCIDNLETLLVDRPEAFTIFFEGLPERWKVLITSRITVDGAKTLAIGALTAEGAKSLAYKYLSSKGLELPSGDVIQQIITSSGRNPLALRLTIDRYSNGHSIVNAAVQAEKDIVSFSYKNLVETLSEHSVLVLEALFVKDQFVRGELVEVLGLDNDATAEAVRALTRTSLVIRVPDGNEERFSLSPSVRDLLRDYPRNLATRQKVKARIDSQAKAVRLHKNIQAQHGFSPFSEDFIPDDCPSNLAAVLVTAIKLLRSDSCGHQQLIAAISRLTQLAKSYSSNAQALTVLGKLHLKVNDDLAAENWFQQAVQAGSGSPAPKLVFVDYLLRRERQDEALRLTESLINEGWADESKADEVIARRIWGAHIRVLIENRLFERLLGLDQLAPNCGEWFKELIRCSKAHAVIAKASPLHSDDPGGVIDAFLASSKLLAEPVRHERVRGNWIRAFRLLCRELVHFGDTHPDFRPANVSLSPLMVCVTANAENVYENAALNAVRTEASPALRRLYQMASTEDKGLFNSHWIRSVVGHSNEDHSALRCLEDNGYRILTVYKVPYASDNIPAFVFAEDGKGQRYFVGKYACRNFDFIAWAQLAVGVKIAARDFRNPASTEHYPKPEDVMLIR